MSLSIKEKIAKDVRAKKCSYSCIAKKYGVDVDFVREVAKPWRKRETEKDRARRKLNKLTTGVSSRPELVGKPSESSVLSADSETETECKSSLLGNIFAGIVLACITAMILSITFWVAKGCLGF